MKRFVYWFYFRWCMWRGIIPADPWHLTVNPDAIRELRKRILRDGGYKS